MKPKILILMTGSIAAYKTCHVVSQLHQKGYDLEIVLTKSCQEFIGAATLEGLTGKTPHTDMYEAGHVMDHIHLVRWADLILVAPATANFINRCAAGIGDDFLTTLFLAHDFKKPFLVAPAMNTKMYLHPATQNSIQKIREYGVEVLETASGVLACGENGWGRLLEPQLIVEEVEKYFSDFNTKKNPHPKKRKILVTAGGTSEPLDSVRSITNFSTGTTGSLIAQSLAQNGFEVTLLLSENHRVHLNDLLETSNLKIEKFKTHDDLQNLINKNLDSFQFHAFLHAAAVSDYELAKTTTIDGGALLQTGDKIDSGQRILLELKPTTKIISTLKQTAQSKNMLLFGFKLTDTPDQDLRHKKVSSLFDSSPCDYVIQNDLSEIEATSHTFHLYSKDMTQVTFQSAESLAQKLNLILSEGVTHDSRS